MCAARLTAVALAVCIAGFAAPAHARAGEESPRCPVRALDRADGPVDITFWHVQQVRNEEILVGLIDQFEASQDRVRVQLVNQVTYPDVFQKYQAALSTGDLPDLVQLDETAIQALVDSESTIPIASCVDADDYSLDDFLAPAIDHYTTEGVLRAMPWTVSNPVLIYDKSAFRAAGLDPEDPPQTLDEVTEYSREIVAAGAAQQGIALRAEASVNEAFYAKSGQLYMNHENGRDARATKTLLNNATGRDIWSWWGDISESGLAYFTGSQPDNVDNLFALGTGAAAMTIDASSVIGSAFAFLESGQYEDLELGVAPLPSLEADGGVPIGDGSLWIPRTGSGAEEAAAWELVEFLSAPEQQAAFAVGSRGGYIPIRESAVDDPALQAMWGENPDLRVPYDQLVAGGSNPAALGPVTGGYAAVRVAVRDALTAMFVEGLTPGDGVKQAQREATDAIQEYNERIGA